MKETEEQTWIRINEENKSLNSFEIAKLYHFEMLKSSLPTEEEIREIANAEVGYIHDTVVTDTFKRGFKAAIELLTKK